MAKQIGIITALVCVTLLGIGALVAFPEAIVMFIIAFCVTAAARPIVSALMAHGLKRGLAVLLTYLYILGVLILIIVVLAGPLTSNLQRITDRAIVDFNLMRVLWANGTPLQQWLIERIPTTEQLYSLVIGDNAASTANRFFGITSSLVGFVSQAIAILILSIYWTIDRVHFERLWLSLLPVHSRTKWRDISHDVENDLGAYIRSEAVQTVLAGFLLFVGFYSVGMPFATLLAVFGAVVWLIPWLGAVLALAAVFLTGSWVSTPQITWICMVITMIVFAFLELYIEPRIFKRRRYSSWLTIILFMALGQVFGLIGMILAPPIGTALEIIMRRVSQFNNDSSPEPEQSSALVRLRAFRKKLAELKQEFNAGNDEVSPQSISLLERLEQLSDRARNELHL